MVTAGIDGRATWSEDAERSYLGACLLRSKACDLLTEDLLCEDFYRPLHQKIAAAIHDLHTVSLRVDPVTVLDRMVALNDGRPVDGVDVAFLTALQADTPVTTNAPDYAAIIKDRSLRRAWRMRFSADLARADDLSVAVDELVEDQRMWLDALALSGSTVGIPPTIDEFLAVPAAYDWIIPGVLERMDRLIVTGGEGAGKSVMLDQLAFQASAGIHPFRSNAVRYRPLRVFRLDVENSRAQVGRRMARLRPLVNPASGQAMIGGAYDGFEFDPSNFRIEIQSRINLLTRADRAWFTAKIDACRPDLVICGPIYKLIEADNNDERHAREFAAYIDHLRQRYGCAFIIEAHSPHGTNGDLRGLRPIGSSLWMRWPEFGFGISKDVDDPSVYRWHSWRGPRDEARTWPRGLVRGGRWPWMNIDDAGSSSEPADTREAF